MDNLLLGKFDCSMSIIIRHVNLSIDSIVDFNWFISDTWIDDIDVSEIFNDNGNDELASDSIDDMDLSSVFEGTFFDKFYS